MNTTTRKLIRAAAVPALALAFVAASAGMAAAIEPVDDPLAIGPLHHRIEPVENPIIWF